MKLSLNGNNKNPLDPFNHKDDSLDPKKEKKNELEPEDNQTIQIDPFGGKKPPKKKPPRKTKIADLPKENNEDQKIKEEKEIKKDTIETITEKVSSEPSSTLDSLTKKIKTNSAQKEKVLKEKKPLNPNIKKALIIGIPITCFLILFAIFKNPFFKAIEEIKNNTYIDSEYVMMPAITGYEEKEAIEILKKHNLKTEIEYMYNKYFDNGTVIKCSVDADNPVIKGSTIKVYICKDENLEEVPKGENYFADIRLPDCPISKNSIILTSVKLNDVYLTLNFKNNSSKTISSIRYTLGYSDYAGIKFVNRSYTIEDLNLQPQETISDKIELTNSKINGITLEYIEFTYIRN